MGKLWLTVVCCWLASCALGATDFVWKTGSTMNVACASGEEPVVQVALDLLKRDCEAVLSQPFSVMETEGDIYIGTQGKSTLLEKVAKREGIDLSCLNGHPEAFFIKVLKNGKLLVAGSDKRGTAYGILELSRMLGVSPWEWWADATPEKKNGMAHRSGLLQAGLSDGTLPGHLHQR